MTYAVVQNQLEQPEATALAAAFRSLDDLVDIDAAYFTDDAYGIIMDGLPREKASRLSAALNAEGVSTDLVPDAEFPKLMQGQRVRRLDCTPEHLLLYDALERTTQVSWDHVVMVAAGFVSAPEIRRIERMRVEARGGGGRSCPILVTDISRKEESKGRLELELYLDVAPVRIAISAHEFQYNYLGERLKTGYMDNFTLLVQDVTHFASSAILNRGAESLRDDTTVTFHYPTVHAFEEETTWLLWRAMRSRQKEFEE